MNSEKASGKQECEALHWVALWRWYAIHFVVFRLMDQTSLRHLLQERNGVLRWLITRLTPERRSVLMSRVKSKDTSPESKYPPAKPGALGFSRSKRLCRR